MLRFAPLLTLVGSLLLGPVPLSAQADLTLEHKVGQLIVPRLSGAFASADSPQLRELEELAREGKIGGVVLFAGPPYEARRLVERIERASAIPPLIASDYEWGIAMRVEGATRLPRAMALSAAVLAVEEEDPAAAEAMVRDHARVTAAEARALGVEVVLAPVLDVVAVPGVIGTRSFGSDPQRVAELGALWIEELQANGLFAVAKHYPGHGATRDDSHFTLPLVESPLEIFAQRDLVPFERAVEVGVAGVMPGHLAVPALDGRDDRPASRSPEILDRLRNGTGGGPSYDGLIVTDALDMEGAKVFEWDGGVAIEALQAGVDVLLLPPDPRVAHAAIVDAVRAGRISEARIDEALGRVLELKARLAEERRTRPPWEALDESLSEADSLAVADRIARDSLTLVGDPASVLPLSGRAPPRLLLVSVVRDRDRATDTDALRAALSRRAARVGASVLVESALDQGLPPVEEVVETADVVVLAHYGRHEAGREELAAWLELVEAASIPTVVVSFQDPWVTPTLGPGSGRAHLVAWDGARAAQRAVAAALFGETTVRGRLPLPLEAQGEGDGEDERVGYAFGAGETLERTVASLEEERLRDGWVDPEVEWQPALDLLQGAIADGAFPGAVAVVVHRGEVALATAVGRQTYAADAPAIELDTLWDLASLTKVVVTTTLSMMAVDEGRLDLEAPVTSYLPEFTGGGKDDVRVADLLTHSSGVLWWTDLYLRHGDQPFDEAWRDYLEEIFGLPLETPPGTEMRYSDLGIMMLGRILELVYGRDFEELARTRVFEPLGMADSRFSPPAELLPRIAPTEIDEEWRGTLVHGAVHDENAYGLSGVAPHAGLFSTGRDLAVFSQMLLDGGFGNGRRLINGSTVARFTRRAERIPGSSRALGWDTPSQPSSAGKLFSERSFGHTGFTGTSIWVDPERELISILLTNRVHPTRERRGIYELRGRYHDAVATAIDASRSGAFDGELARP